MVKKSTARRNVNHRARDFEKQVAKDLTNAGIPSDWVDRGDDWGRSDTDVKVEGYPEIQIDCKSKQMWSHHTLFETDVIARYCLKPTDIAVMPTKKKNQRGWYCTIDGPTFCKLLLAYIEQQKQGGRIAPAKGPSIDL